MRIPHERHRALDRRGAHGGEEDRDARLAEVLDERAELPRAKRHARVEPRDEARAVGEEEEERDQHHHGLEEDGPGRGEDAPDGRGGLPALLAGEPLQLLLQLGDEADELPRGVLHRPGEPLHESPHPLALDRLAEPLHAVRHLGDEDRAEPAEREEHDDEQPHRHDRRGERPPPAQPARQPLHHGAERGREHRREEERLPERPHDDERQRERGEHEEEEQAARVQIGHGRS